MFKKILKLKRFEYLPHALPNLGDEIVKEFIFTDDYVNKFQIYCEIFENFYEKITIEDFVKSRQKFEIEFRFLDEKINSFKELICNKLKINITNVSRKGISIYILKNETLISNTINDLPLVFVEVINDNATNETEKRTYHYGII